MSQTVAEVFIETLIAAGVHRIYGGSGDSLNAFIQVVHKRKEEDGAIDWLLFRHEETAAYAAGAHAELTGNLAVCAGSCGPAISISSAACSIASAAVFLFSPSQRKFRQAKSARATSRKRTLSISSKTAATSASSSPSLTSFPAYWLSPCAPPSPSAA